MPRKSIAPPEAKIIVYEGGKRFLLRIPLKTISEGNVHSHWREAHKRHKIQKNTVYKFFNCLNYYISSIVSLLPCKVSLKRFAPGTLDEDDNLRMAFKWVKDAVAERLTGDYVVGRADSNKNIAWNYYQEYSACYYIEILLEFP